MGAREVEREAREEELQVWQRYSKASSVRLNGRTHVSEGPRKTGCVPFVLDQAHEYAFRYVGYTYRSLQLFTGSTDERRGVEPGVATPSSALP